ncbi:MAG: MoxR family ATPase [Leptolyngbya sp. SIO1E4]|nr:MoxR family ATPase [Leptolyngbya sp. SIO1E4]
MSEAMRYEGTLQPPVEGARDTELRRYYPYLPEPGLVEAVNLAIDLHRPLLLEGEPGCGKTRLAGAVAYELTQKVRQGTKKGNQDFWWPYFSWNVKSTSRVRDGLYRYDAVNRLRDTQIVGADPERLQGFLDESEADKFQKLRQELKQVLQRLMDWEKAYFKWGPLGEALQWQKNYRPILLIDEIDKADSDFPNDLLLELEEFRFDIPELGQSITPPPEEQEPIIFITSNREKPLPDPFLRRCVYYYVEFPQKGHLTEIIQQRFESVSKNEAKLIKLAVEQFYAIREILEPQPGSRPPGTSEFLEFLTVILRRAKRTSVDDTVKVVEKLAEHDSLLGILLKTKADQDLYHDYVNQDD